MGADSKAGDDDEWQTTVDASYAKKGSEVETCSLALCASHETTVVDVSHNALLDVGLALLLDPLKRCRNLTRLCLAHCGLTDGAVGSLSTLVAALERTLTELDVGHNNFSLEGCGALGDVLRTNRVMQRCRVRLFFIPMDRLRGSEDLVDISKDIFRPADGAFISRICVDGDVGTLKLNHAPLPLRLLINGCHHRGRPNAVELVSQRLRTEDALVISAALEFARAPGLEVLKLDDNDLGADAALALARALRTNLFLKRLSVNKCRLTDDGERREGVSAVAEALEFNDSLRSLELRENGIDDGAAADFARCVKENRGLTRLDLRANDFDDGPGGTALGMALTKNDFVTVFNGMDLFGTSEHREFRQTVVHGGASVGPGPATSINLARNQEDGFQVYEVVFLASRMRAAGHLRDLDLDANDLGAAHLVALCGGLSHARSLESLSLAANRLCDVYTDKTHRVRGNYDGSGLEALAAYLAGAEAPPTLRRLDLRRSHVDDRAHALARAIYTSEHLALDVLNGIEAVCDGAPVVALDVSGRRHGAASYEVAFVARAVRDSNTLLSLEAKSCALCGRQGDGSGKFSARPLEFLADALAHRGGRCAALTRLDVSSNAICAQGAAALFEALAENGVLEMLDISNAELTTSVVNYTTARDLSAISALARALSSPRSRLRHLRLDANAFGDDGTAALESALGENGCLETLSLAANGIGVEGAGNLARALRSNGALRHLSLEGNRLTGDRRDEPRGVVCLADALRGNGFLRVLDLRGSGLDDAAHAAGLLDAAVAIADCLHENPKIQRIAL
ncbi:hypothetical protein M885DRAFT_569844 [Pelagophyceae sp. CCMP2097]|nr:hypothetical protein M885DRAFT_569844 [Pelagophyceae sp. CCMP2097]